MKLRLPRLVLFIFIGFCVFTTTSCLKDPVGQFGHISGVITYQGLPESKVSITLNSDPSITTTTDDKGYYEFRNIIPGEYLLEFEKSEFGIRNRVVDLKAGNQLEVNMDLYKIPKVGFSLMQISNTQMIASCFLISSGDFPCDSIGFAIYKNYDHSADSSHVMYFYNSRNSTTLLLNNSEIFYINNLESNTTYYIQAFALTTESDYHYLKTDRNFINYHGSGFSEIYSVKTLPGTPQVQTLAVIEIEPTFAKFVGKVHDNEGGTIKEYGFKIYDYKTQAYVGKVLATTVSETDFSVRVSGLQPGTTYLAKAYADNTWETGSGNLIRFRTSDSLLVKDYDGNIYTTININGQIWLRENMRTTHYADGNSINEVYLYNNNTSMPTALGLLYTWKAAMNNVTTPGAQGICPNGFHIPTTTDWSILVSNSGGDYFSAGYHLKTPDNYYWNESNWADNSTGFSALPAGRRQSNEMFSGYSYYGFFWSSEEFDDNNAAHFFVQYNVKKLDSEGALKNFAESVRCVKN